MKRQISLTLAILFIFSSLSIAQFKYMRTVQILFQLTRMASTKDGPDNKLKIFKPGDPIWIHLLVSGLKKNENSEIDIEADFEMKGQGLKSVLNKGKILDGKWQRQSDKIPFFFTIYLTPQIAPGSYYVEIKLTDRVAKKFNIYYVSFRIEK